MDIQKGKPFVNRTWKYLFPCMKYYDKEFIDMISTVFKLSVGIGDALHTNRLDTPCIYILIDKTINPIAVGKLINWSRNQVYYVDHYDTDYLSSTLMLVLKIPKRFEDTYKYFLNGEYSKMYPTKDLYYLYKDVENSTLDPMWEDAKNVLNMHSSMITPFIKLLKETFGNSVDTKFKDLVGKELDLPTKLFFKEEVFHYGKKKI